MDDEVCDYEEITIEDMAHYIKEAYYNHDFKQTLQLWYDYSDDIVLTMTTGEIGSLEMTQMHEQLHGLVEHELTTAIRALELGLEVVK